jgi:hypothetical protein
MVTLLLLLQGVIQMMAIEMALAIDCQRVWQVPKRLISRRSCRLWRCKSNRYTKNLSGEIAPVDVISRSECRAGLNETLSQMP